MRLGRHRRQGRFARTNRPERFVGNGDSCKLLARKHAHAVAKLLSDHVSRVLLFEFSYANNRCETSLQRGQNLLRYGFICFAKILAPWLWPTITCEPPDARIIGPEISPV